MPARIAAAALLLAAVPALDSCHRHHRRRAPAEPEPPAPTVTLAAIEVLPAGPVIPKGMAVQFSATGIYSDQTRRELTGEVVWTSTNGTVASVSDAPGSKGLATALDQGSTNIRATLESVTGFTPLTVGPPELVSIAVTPTNPSIALGTTQRFAATGTYSDATTRDLTEEAVWDSSDPAVASVSNAPGSRGLATASAKGETAIGAAAGAVSGSTTLMVTDAVLVSIAVTPANPSLALGTTRRFQATGTYSDRTTQDLTEEAAWDSSDAQVASVSNLPGEKGLATALRKGSTAIRAAVGVLSGSTTLTVTDAALVSIALAPANPSIVQGTNQEFKATGTYTDNSTQDVTAQAVWDSSDTRVATVSNAPGEKGLARGVAAGSALIRAAVGAVSGSTTLTVTEAVLLSIAVTPENPTIALGTKQEFQATASYSNGSSQDLTAQVSWESSDPAVATIANAPGEKGLATSVAKGTTTIRAVEGTVSGSTALTVTDAALRSIAVTPENPSIALGTSRQFAARGTYTDSSTQDLTASVTWESTGTDVATISNASGEKGLASSVAKGTTTIRAVEGPVSGSTTLTVTDAALRSIAVTPENPSIPAQETLQFKAEGAFTDRSLQDLTALVTWDSSSPAVALVSNAQGSKGLATGVAAGSTAIGAALGAVRGSTTLTVTAARARFVRCEANQDEKQDIADGVWILMELFGGQARTGCLKAADCNDDGELNLADALHCFDYQLRGGPRPPDPFGGCGLDPTGDALSCESYARCR